MAKIKHNPKAAFKEKRLLEQSLRRLLKEKIKKVAALDLALREMTKYAEETTKELNNLRDAFERYKQMTKSAVGSALDRHEAEQQKKLIDFMAKLITGRAEEEYVDVRTS